MKKYTIEKVAPLGTTYILHNLEPKFKMQIIQNNNFEYDTWNDIYDLFEFRGNKFVFVIVSSEIDLDKVDDFRQIRSIINRAWKWYRSQVHIEKYTPEDEESVMEDERFILQESKNTNWWVCTDKESKIVCEFKNEMFNDSQKVTPLEDFDFQKVGVTGIAKIIREMGDWLNENHAEKL